MATVVDPADDLAIRSLIARYSDAVICGDGAAAASVYADDGVLEAFGGPPLEGRDAIAAALRARIGRGGFAYQIMAVVAVGVDGDVGSARSHYLEISGPLDGDVGRLSTGAAEDRLVRTVDGWRIAHRRLTRSYVGDLAAPGKVTPLDLGALGADGSAGDV